jgi:hypothetical protein
VLKKVLSLIAASLLVAVSAHAGLIGVTGSRYIPPAVLPDVQPANYTMELVLPREAGTAPIVESETPNMPANHRIFKAYPGIEYNIRAVVLHGSYPFTYELSGGVSWLSVDPDTGEISGTAPVVTNGTTYTPTLTVTDAAGTERSEAWTITVTNATSAFRFIDCDTDGSGDTGSEAAPYDSLAQLKASGVTNVVVYFREGVCNVPTTGITDSDYVSYNNPSGNWRRMEWRGDLSPVQWVAYPGEAAVIDGSYVEDVEQGAHIRLQDMQSGGYPVYLDGLEFRNFYHMAMQLAGENDYVVIRRNNFHDIKNSFDGSNSAAIDSMATSNSGEMRHYVAYQDNWFHDNAAGSMKIYYHYKSLMEDNLHEGNGVVGADTGSDWFAGGPDHKGAPGRFEVRHNTYRNCIYVPTGGNETTADAGFGGNMNYGDADVTDALERASGEVRYNTFGCFTDTDPGLRIVDMNNFGNAGEIFIYRNTGVGRWNVQRSSEVGAGPFHIYDNIIVNDTGAGNTDRITFSVVGGEGTAGDGDDIVYGSGNDVNITYSVAGAEDVILDADTLLLIGAARTEHLGSKGAELQ